MLRPEIPTLAPPAYLLDEPHQPAGDPRLDEARTDEQQTNERQAAA